MKMVIAIVRNENAGILLDEMTKEGFRVTKLATTGGFLKKGNTTLLSGVENDYLDNCLELIARVCKSSGCPVTVQVENQDGAYSNSAVPIEVPCGTAVFVLDAEKLVI